MDEVSETELLDACEKGRLLECSDGEARRPVDAALLRRCCHELKDRVDPRGLIIRKAAVMGRLDLAGLGVPFPLRFEECEFDAAPVVEGARLHELALIGCERLPGLLANGLQVSRDLDLSRSSVTGGHYTSASTSKRSAIWLCESDIGGRLLCVDTIINADGERSIQADRMHVGGTVRLLHKFTARGEIRLLGVRIDGSLDLTAARIESSVGPAIDLGDAIIEGSLFLIDDTMGRRPVIRGRLDLGSVHISGQFLIRNATLEESGTPPAGGGYSRSRTQGTAVSAPRLSVGAQMSLEGTSEVTGGVDLSMSDMSSLSIDGRCLLRAAGRTALDLTNAELRSSVNVNAGATVQGTTRLAGARIHGNLSLQGAVLTAPERSSLIAAQGLRVDGDVELHGLRATGGRLRFRNATLGSIVAVGTRLVNPGGFTLSLHQTTVNGSVVLAENFESIGLVMLSRSNIEGRLECAGGSFICPAPFKRNPSGHAIEAISTTVRAGMDLNWASVAPSVDFTNATTTFLADDPQNWPQGFLISGFVYERYEHSQQASSRNAWDYVARCDWLDRQSIRDSGPYEHAARVFRQHGYTNEAEKILIAQRRQTRQSIDGRGALLRRAMDVIYGASVGYGYRPGRVLWLLAILLILVVASVEIPAGQKTLRTTNAAGDVYTTHGPVSIVKTNGTRLDSCGNGQVRCFNPILYATDTVVPLISLNQRSTWYPDPHTRYGTLIQWWLNTATVLGWLLSSIFILSFTRLARTT